MSVHPSHSSEQRAVSDKRLRQYAVSACEKALTALDPECLSEDAVAELELALMAASLWASPDRAPSQIKLDPEDVTEIIEREDAVESGEACICPPDLVARGGFRAGCPVHA